MPQGRIIKALAGYYYVEAGQQSIQCRARGIFKKKKISPLVGDLVEYELTGGEEGVINEILPRQSELIRPPIANVNQAILVFSAKEPDFSPQLLDKFLVHTEKAGIDSIICITKVDLIEEEQLAEIKENYAKIGYPIVMTSSKQDRGIEEVREYLKGHLSVFAGQSGVGKSSLLNQLFKHLDLETAPISYKLGRGKHTTRHVELIPLPEGGWVADTPGFSSLDFQLIEAEELGHCFREIREHSVHCKFRGCLHLNEPACRVREVLEEGQILQSRYNHYTQFLREIKDRKPRY
jgi:ribosome biogenesis GTPase